MDSPVIDKDHEDLEGEEIVEESAFAPFDVGLAVRVRQLITAHYCEWPASTGQDNCR